MTRPMRRSLFLSWCHDDRAAKDALVGPLMTNLRILDGLDVDWWEDSHLHVGDEWRRKILTQLDSCDYGVLLMSPAFLASTFVTEHELPHFVGSAATKGALPVGLKEVPLDGTRRLYGIDRYQIFTDPRSGRFFTQTSGADRERFAMELAGAIRRRLLTDA